MYVEAKERFRAELDAIRAAGLWKDERVIEGPQGARVAVTGREALNFCANNYLGLAGDPALVRAAQAGLERWGFGLSSVRFICGTQTIHKELEAAIARFLGTEDAILYTSCFDANGGLFETLLGEEDAVISDALNHASIIDGIRLCRAERHRYEHGDMAELERAPRGDPRRPHAADRHRRRLLDGRRRRAARRDLRPRRASRRARHGRRQPRHRLRRPDRPRHARALRGGVTASTSSPRPSARRSAAPAAASPRPGARSSTCSASARARTSSPTRCRRRSSPPRWRASSCSRGARRCATGSPPTRAGSATP